VLTNVRDVKKPQPNVLLVKPTEEKPQPVNVLMVSIPPLITNVSNVITDVPNVPEDLKTTIQNVLGVLENPEKSNQIVDVEKDTSTRKTLSNVRNVTTSVPLVKTLLTTVPLAERTLPLKKVVTVMMDTSRLTKKIVPNVTNNVTNVTKTPTIVPIVLKTEMVPQPVNVKKVSMKPKKKVKESVNSALILVKNVPPKTPVPNVLLIDLTNQDVTNAHLENTLKLVNQNVNLVKTTTNIVPPVPTNLVPNVTLH